MILRLRVTMLVHDKIAKKIKSNIFLPRKGVKIARVAINHKTWSHVVNADAKRMAGLSHKINL